MPMSVQSAIDFFKHIHESEGLWNHLGDTNTLEFSSFQKIALELNYDFSYFEFQKAFKYYWDFQWHLDNGKNHSNVK